MIKKLLVLLILAVSISGCTQQTELLDNNATENPTQNNTINQNTTQLDNNITTEDLEEDNTNDVNETDQSEITEPDLVEPEDLVSGYQSYQVNELGQIMVVMYHNLAEKPGSYATTVDLFKADLERLYSEGYRTISMSDLVLGNIDIPLGTTPVVLTFDDATKSNFFYDETGAISRESVVGILDAFYEEHPDFGKNAIFYVYGSNPFRESSLIEVKLNYLIKEGYEIGNHTYEHEPFDIYNAEGIQKTLVLNEQFIDQYVKDYDMIHLCLPYGKKPAKELIPFLFDGTYNSISYHIVSAVNVGWNPIKSPYHIGFDPKSINRITCGDDKFELQYWMDYFLENPDKKYISDGNPNTIVYPSTYAEYLGATSLETILYEMEATN